ncbi:hypothetical protein Tco_0543510 [Tanacetum coccineum]
MLFESLGVLIKMELRKTCCGRGGREWLSKIVVVFVAFAVWWFVNADAQWVESASVSAVVFSLLASRGLSLKN